MLVLALALTTFDAKTVNTIFLCLTLCNVESGKKAFTDCDGMRILYTTSQETLDCQELESVVYLSSLIMRKCFPRNRLPLSVLRSPISCPLPVSDFHVLDTNEEQGEYQTVVFIYCVEKEKM